MKFKIMRPLLKAWRARDYRAGTIGRSLAVGMVIGFSPTVGFQVILCLAVCFLWNRVSKYKLSIPPAVVGSLVVNPLTMGPTYFVYYEIGCLAMRCEGKWSMERLGSLSSVTEMGWTLFLSLWLGSIPFMIGGYFLGGYLGDRMEAFLRNRQLRRHGRRLPAPDRLIG
ncbi:MAG: DUF2062 domain-containing protein [Geminicoccaceae bacterium]|nr:DUF2062 domain-containing protein [Geminicoccaceae bacterium]